MKKRNVCFAISTRGNYAKVKSTLEIMRVDSNLEASIIVAGGTLLRAFGKVDELIESEGHSITERLQFLLAGDDLASMGLSAGLATQQFVSAFERIKPDIVFVIADRYEALSIAHAALCMNIPIAHLEGGEISGSIDDRIRNSITKLANFHLPSNELAVSRLLSLGEWPETIKKVGSPTIDLLRNLDLENKGKIRKLENFTDKPNFNFDEKYVVVSQHSVPSEVHLTKNQITETIKALKNLKTQVIWILPNMDAGFLVANETLNEFKEYTNNWVVLPSLPFELYSILINHAACLIGNTSSGIRESEFLGVPVVNIGTRQNDRQRGENVVDVIHNSEDISDAIAQQLLIDKYNTQFLYGDGNSAKLIADALLNMPLTTDKRM